MPTGPKKQSHTLKGIEYNVKLHHQALRLKDYTVIEGHLGKEMEEGKPVLDHKGKEIEENLIFVETSKLTFNTVRFHKPWIEELLTQAEHHHSKIREWAAETNRAFATESEMCRARRDLYELMEKLGLQKAAAMPEAAM